MITYHGLMKLMSRARMQDCYFAVMFHLRAIAAPKIEILCLAD
jgi:hypothetical protein